MTNPDTFWLAFYVIAIVVFCLGVTMYVVWRLGSEPDETDERSGDGW